MADQDQASGDLGSLGNWQAELDAIEPDGPATGAGAGWLETGLDGQPIPPPQPQKQHVKQTAFEEYLFQRGRENDESLDTAVRTSAEQWQHAEALAADVFNALFKPTPELQDVDPDYQRNADALDQAMETQEWQGLHQYTQLDDLATGIASAAMTKKITQTILEQLQDEPPTAPEAPTPPQDGDGNPDPNDPDYQAAQQLFQHLLQQYQQALARQQNAQGQQMRAAVRQAAQQAQQQVQQMQAALDAFSGNGDEIGPGWGSEPGGPEMRRGDMMTRAKLARQVASNPKLKNIARWAGKMRFLAAAAQKQRGRFSTEQQVGITLGDNLAETLPSELVLMADPATADMFWMNLLQGEVFTYDYQGEKPIGKGPIVLCTDESHSMLGGPDEWTAAVGLALLSIAAKQRRDLRWIHFAGPRKLVVDDFPQGRGTPEQVMDAVLRFLGGGTDFDGPLNRALEAIDQAEFAKADVVFVTDGVCRVSPDVLDHWLRSKSARNFSCYGILLGSRSGMPSMQTFCDAVAHLMDVGGEGDEAVLAPAFSI